MTLGSPLVNNFDGGISTSALTVQLSFDPATSPNPVVSPANGTITDWKVKSADDGAVYTLKVMRPNGPVSIIPATTTNFTAVTSVQAPSPVPIGTFAGTPTGVIFDYPASLPISKGDYIGVVTGGASNDLPQAMANMLPQSTFANNFGSLPTDGNSADLTADAQHELLLQETIQFTPPVSPVNPAGKAKCKKKKKKRSAETAKKKKKKKKCKKEEEEEEAPPLAGHCR